MMRALKLILGMLVAAVMMPTAARAQDDRIEIPVAVVTIYPGDEITAELLVERAVRNRRVLTRSYFGSMEGLVGKVAARVLPAGKAIPLNAVREPHVFKEGARVMLRFGSGALSITSAGQALQPGVVGSFVDVRNLDTGIVVRGEVQADGAVRIGGS